LSQERDPQLYAPLAGLRGASPPAPEWFQRAVALEPERRFVDVHGVAIEALGWGRDGAPGLLLVHGNGANADWWRFIAPFFADDYKVAAFSLSGMGQSQWRPSYGDAYFGAEALAVGNSFGLFASTTKPLLVGHSLGSAVSILLAARCGERFSGTVALDMHVAGPNHRWGLGRVPAAQPRSSDNMIDMLARFRFAPPQPCHGLYIADFIARASIRQVNVEGRTAWTWRFDFDDVWLALPKVSCRLALVRGELSTLTSPSQLLAMQRNSPPGTLALSIPAAHHHMMVDQPLALVTALRAIFSAWQVHSPATP
jgi:pimeloyl-ACP methyl ester carboxylesterase